MKKLLVIMLTLGLVCLAGAAFAQTITPVADNGGTNSNTTGGTSVNVPNANIAGASGTGTDTNMNGDVTGDSDCRARPHRPAWRRRQ